MLCMNPLHQPTPSSSPARQQLNVLMSEVPLYMYFLKVISAPLAKSLHTEKLYPKIFGPGTRWARRRREGPCGPPQRAHAALSGLGTLCIPNPMVVGWVAHPAGVPPPVLAGVQGCFLFCPRRKPWNAGARAPQGALDPRRSLPYPIQWWWIRWS
jgi:hypothetical protein